MGIHFLMTKLKNSLDGCSINGQKLRLKCCNQL